LKAYLRTFGCRANQYDTEAVRAMIEAAGGAVVDCAEEADVAVFNSCSVTAGAEADLRQAVRRVAKENAGIRSLVIGCASARDDGTIAALPAVSDAIAYADLRAVARRWASIHGSRRSRRDANGVARCTRIQDGCEEHCTFCSTTVARGAHRPRPADELSVRHAYCRRSIPRSKTGIHIGSYGTEHGSSLGALVERLVREVPRVRYRLTSVEATEVDARLADLLVADPLRVAPHLHAPLQSGSDRVLRRMGRHWYTARAYAGAAERISARAPVFALGADVMTGFPGETDADHAATIALVRSLPFTYLHVFPYSERPGTAAVRLDGEVPASVSRGRAAELRALSDEKAAAYLARRDGGSADVVVVGDGNRREGLTEDYLTVALADEAMPRRSRFFGRLDADADGKLTARVN
jgi:threonylcarbamoyladenosine tRNA methylthiotransferase MtaB